MRCLVGTRLCYRVALREVEMSKKPTTHAIWDTMIQRYIIATIIGLIVAIYFFYRMYMQPVTEPVPMSMVVGASIGGLVTCSGIFGIAISLIFKMMGKG